jgi:hypothetical protein
MSESSFERRSEKPTKLRMRRVNREEILQARRREMAEHLRAEHPEVDDFGDPVDYDRPETSVFDCSVCNRLKQRIFTRLE